MSLKLTNFDTFGITFILSWFICFLYPYMHDIRNTMCAINFQKNAATTPWVCSKTSSHTRKFSKAQRDDAMRIECMKYWRIVRRKVYEKESYESYFTFMLNWRVEGEGEGGKVNVRKKNLIKKLAWKLEKLWGRYAHFS